MSVDTIHTCSIADNGLYRLENLWININKPLLRNGMLITFTLIYVENYELSVDTIDI